MFLANDSINAVQWRPTSYRKTNGNMPILPVLITQVVVDRLRPHAVVFETVWGPARSP